LIYGHSLTFASRPQRPDLDSLKHVTRGSQRRRSRKIRRSTQWIVGIVQIASSSPLNRRRKDHSDNLLTPRSGVKSIAS
jgi:hypothetical protein